jgi:hypothetical protein
LKLLEQLVRVRFFVAATLAIFVASSLAGSAGGRTLAILTLALEPLLLLGWTWAWHAYRKGTLAGFAALELEAVEAADGDLPQGLEQTRAELRSLGFRLVGQLRRRFPWQDWQPDWAFLDRDGVSGAFLAPDGALTFATYWPDASLVVTAAGVRPLRIDLPMIEQRNVSGRPADVYRRHMDACERFAEVHGLAAPLASIDDVAEQERAVIPSRREGFAVQSTGRGAMITEYAVCGLAVVLLVFELAALV